MRGWREEEGRGRRKEVGIYRVKGVEKLRGGGGGDGWVEERCVGGRGDGHVHVSTNSLYFSSGMASS